MRERYGKRWNPTDRERKIMGLPSRAEEREARARGENVEIGAPPKEKVQGDKQNKTQTQTQTLGAGSGAPTRQAAGQLQGRSQMSVR